MNNSSVVVEGKTKIIESTNHQDVVRIISKDFLTGGDAAKKENIKDIGMHKTKQTTNVFKMLTYEGIPTSFVKMESSNTLLCHRCEMLPLEFVVRRYAWGSYLKRNNKINSNDKPHVFKKPIYEIFHKHAVIMPPHVDQPRQMEETIAREKYLKNGIWKEGVYTDPYIKVGKSWELYSAKKPITDPPLMKIDKILSDQELNSVINKIILPSFMAIENNWNKVDTVDGPVHLVDIKFELGIKSIDNSIVLSDVVDNDSWRIWPGGNPAKQLDKQSFREGENLISVANKYELVTKLTSQFKGVK